MVVATADLTPRMRRVVIAGEELRGFENGQLPADAVKLALPAAAAKTAPQLQPELTEGDTAPLYRAYTVRDYDPTTTHMTLDVLLHGDSPGSRWAREAEPGDRISWYGPRSDFYASPEASWHLILGDESALPAIAAILESLPRSTVARVFVEVADETDELSLTSPARAEITWLHRKGVPAGNSDLLERAVREMGPLRGTPQTWVAGEAGVVRTLRRYLLREQGLRRETVQASGYWRAGLDASQTDEAVLELARAATDDTSAAH
ncbi:siderophore-interacting protein [Longimycelium tulufanense]|uniref:Siderophore-interacting protein n=1 Tax=Longimycelium tulufanense TaxID=907463 RepID=A0A8J3CD84_9PSEU|nr:siderophore-interacting protein [Longimycelium tulufanense]